jgi:hypothetical protein
MHGKIFTHGIPEFSAYLMYSWVSSPGIPVAVHRCGGDFVEHGAEHQLLISEPFVVIHHSSDILELRYVQFHGSQR